MRIMIFKEFRKQGIKIPYPIRTIYQGDEESEIKKDELFLEGRKKIVDEYGIGDLGKEKEGEE